MPINAHPEYIKSEKEYLSAKTDQSRLYWLEEMIRTAPKHKGAENLLKDLRGRLKKLKEKSEKAKKAGKGKPGIKKEGFQCILIGLPNSGKSSLLAKLTNAKPKISDYPYTTKEPEIGTLDYKGVKAQIVDTPSLSSDEFDYSLLNTADCILIVLESLRDLENISPHLSKASKNRIVILNKTDNFGKEEIRKLKETIKSKKIKGVLVSTKTGEGIEELKQLIIDNMNVIRVYTKEPGKPKTKDPIVLERGSTIKDAAEKILKGFSKKVKQTKLTGPSGKFPNQPVGLNHILKDKDIVEFHTK